MKQTAALHICVSLLLLLMLAGCRNTDERNRETQTESVAVDTAGYIPTAVDTAFAAPIPPVHAAAVDTSANDLLFAFADSTGSQLLAAGTDSLPRARYVVVLPQGTTLRAHHVAVQRESPASTYRAVAANFSRTAGHVFAVDTPALTPNQTYCLVSERFLAGRRLLRLIPGNHTPLDRVMLDRITRLKSRTVRQGWLLAEAPGIGQIAVVLFRDETRNPLAGLILLRSSSIVFEGYAGDARRDGSVWRVDDSGMIEGEAFTIIAAFRSGGSIELVRLWAGTEGENGAYLRQEGERFVTLKDHYRYWAPE